MRLSVLDQFTVAAGHSRDSSIQETLALGRDRGVHAALPSPNTTAAYPVGSAERDRMAAMRRTAFAGTGPQAMGMLRALGREHGVDEVAVLTTMHDPEARRRSYALLADAASLAPEQVPLAAE